jgi:hypothetical protein
MLFMMFLTNLQSASRTKLNLKTASESTPNTSLQFDFFLQNFIKVKEKIILDFLIVLTLYFLKVGGFFVCEHKLCLK